MDLVSVAYAMGNFGGKGGGQESPFAAFVPIILMFVIFYFLLIRPQQRKQKQHRLMLTSLKKDDIIVTQGGIQGRITGLTDSVVTLEIADKVKVKVHRSYIAGLVKNQGATQ